MQKFHVESVISTTTTIIIISDRMQIKYIYSGTALRYLCLSLNFFFCYFILSIHYIWEDNIVISSSLHVFDNLSY